jgi:hypothetical protein
MVAKVERRNEYQLEGCWEEGAHVVTAVSCRARVGRWLTISDGWAAERPMRIRQGFHAGADIYFRQALMADFH